jgi:hypothetical protein
MPLECTSHWRSYIINASQIGLHVVLLVQVVHKAMSSSKVSKDMVLIVVKLRQMGEMVLHLRQKGRDGAANEAEGGDEEEDDDIPFEAGGEIDERETK